MKNLLETLSSFVARIFGKIRRPAGFAANLNDPIRLTYLELEHARAAFNAASHRVTLLTRQLEEARAGGRCNRGQLALMQRTLQQAARNAQATFDAAARAQDELTMLESVKAGQVRIQRPAPISRDTLEEVLRQVALAEARTEQYRELTTELGEAVYGFRNDDSVNLPILAVDEPAGATHTAHPSRPRPAMTHAEAAV